MSGPDNCLEAISISISGEKKKKKKTLSVIKTGSGSREVMTAKMNCQL